MTLSQFPMKSFQLGMKIPGMEESHHEVAVIDKKGEICLHRHRQLHFAIESPNKKGKKNNEGYPSEITDITLTCTGMH